MDLMDLKHLMNRTSFGLRPSDIQLLGTMELNECVNSLFIRQKNTHNHSENQFVIKRKKELSKEEREMMITQEADNRREMNANWIKHMAVTDDTLLEKMVIFWHDHFGVKALLSAVGALHHETLRQHALGSFRDLLHAIAKDPAMLLFLNNQQNKKSSPNENFARELLELFTMGEGNYSEKDIKEAARAFTGWKTSLNGDFLFVKQQHDEGEKTFMGRNGNFNGDDIINIILEQPRTSYFITEKLYRWFVNEKPDSNIISKLSESFFKNNYNISDLLKDIFTSSFFYEKVNRGNKIKSPVDFLVGLLRHFNVTCSDNSSLFTLQKVLGQILFAPPSVAGWTTGRGWIDSSTLLYRMKITPAILLGEDIELIVKDDFDAQEMNNMPKKINNALKGLQFQISEWTKYNHDIKAISNILLAAEPTASVMDYIKQMISKAENGKKTQYALALLSSLPEYQLS